MRLDAVWSVEYGCYIAPEQKQDNPVELGITNCIIIYSIFGYFWLYSNKKRLRKITYKEYETVRHLVKAVYEEVAPNQYELMGA